MDSTSGSTLAGFYYYIVDSEFKNIRVSYFYTTWVQVKRFYKKMVLFSFMVVV
jgi:hypothetical protein